jgi:hypothetical protein
VLKSPLTIQCLDTNRATRASPAGEKDDLVAWWKLDESSGTCAEDASEHALKARLKGPPHWAPDQGTVDGALEFDGVTNCLECADDAKFDVGTQLSVSTWFKSCPSSKQKSQVLLAKGEAWQLQRRGSDGALEFLVTGPLTTNSQAQVRAPNLASKMRLDESQWHQVVGTYDGRRTVLYVDGNEESCSTASGRLAINTAPLTVGESSVSPGHLFAGWMDDVRVYGRCLTASDVQALFNAGHKK